MADVAAAAGLARATLYRHFPTRDDLVAAIRAQAYDEAGAAIAACRLDEGPASDALRRLIEALVAVGDRYRFLQNEAEGEPAGAAAQQARGPAAAAGPRDDPERPGERGVRP